MPQAIPFAIAALQTAAATVATTFGATAIGTSLTAAAASTMAAAGIAGAAATAAGVIGAGIGSVALSAGISALNKPKVPTAGAQISAKKSSIANRTVAMGRSAYGGYIITDPMISGRKNAITSYVVALSGAGDNGTLEKIIYGGEDVTFDANGRAIGRYAGAIWCIQKSGTWSQTAININGVGGLESTAQPSDWGVNDRLLGCAHVMVVFGTQNEPLKSEGAGKEIKFVWVADKVALTDPRTGAAATTLAQRKNPFVWAYSWAMVFATAPSGYAVAGLEIPSAQINQASAAYCANYADTNGFTIAGELSLDPNAAIENLKAICQSGGGGFTIRNGQLYFTCAAANSIVGTITDDDFSALPSMRSLVPAHERINTITPRFRNESNGFEVVDGSAITSSAFLTADNNNERADIIELPYCGGGASQAGKLAALALVNAREPNAYTLPFKPQVRYIGGVSDTLELNCTKLGWTGQKIIIAERTNHPDLQSDITAITETDTKYAWALGQTTTPPNYAQNTRGDAQYAPLPDVGSWAATAVLITDGTTSLPIIRLTGASDFPQASNIIAQIRLASGGAYLDRVVLPPSATQCEFRGLTPNTSYVVGVSYINQYGFEGAVRELSAVSTGVFVAGEAVNAPKIPLGQNCVIDTKFDRITDTSLWFAASSGVTYSKIVGSGGLSQLLMQFGASPTSGALAQFFGRNINRLPIKAGDRVEVSAKVGGYGLSAVYLYIYYWNAAGSAFANDILPLTSGILSGSADLSNYNIREQFGVAPSGTVAASWGIAGQSNGTPFGYCYVTQPLLSRALASQTGFSPYVEGFIAQPNADVTGLNVAAAISGQGTGATANNLTQLNTSEGTKLGGIAAGATVGATTGTNLVSPTYGILVDSAIKTDLGTAAAITNQGTQATASHYRGATYPYTPVEGSWWSDTTASKLKLYTGGAWVVVADIGQSKIQFFTHTGSPITLTTTMQDLATLTLTDSPSGYIYFDSTRAPVFSMSGSSVATDIDCELVLNGTVIGTITLTSVTGSSGGFGTINYTLPDDFYLPRTVSAGTHNIVLRAKKSGSSASILALVPYLKAEGRS